MKTPRAARTPRKLTPEQEQLIVSRYQAGESPTAIFESVGIDKHLFYITLKRLGVSAKRQLNRLTPEQEQAVIERYRAGEGAYAIAPEMGVHVQTVYNLIKKQNIDLQMPGKRLTLLERVLVVEHCVAGHTSVNAATKFGVSQETVLRILKADHISLPKGRPRVYEVDDGAFDILTCESLYWIGFLFADGCVHHDNDGSPLLICGLAEKDRVHLEKLRAFLRSTHPIRWADKTATSLGGPCVYLSIRSQRLCAALTTRGIIAKKVRVPIRELVGSPDFWRGCIDGDGSIGTTVNHGCIYPYIRLSGQITLLETFQSFLKTNGVSLNIAPAGRRDGRVWEIETSGSNALEIINVLYHNAPTSAVLDRKNVRAQALIAGDIERFAPYTEKPSGVKIDEGDNEKVS